MKSKLASFGFALNREAKKKLVGGQGGVVGIIGDCVVDWAYDCSEASPCCTSLCQQNATNTGTICVPIP
jgi:hypothetical protein